MNINNAYNQYQSMNTPVNNPKGSTGKTNSNNINAKEPSDSKSIDMDTVSLSTPSAEEYLKAKNPAIQYRTLDIPKSYGSWDSFKSKELFSANPNIAKDTLALYVHPNLQAKMDADPLFGLETARKAEEFFHSKTDGDEYTMGKDVSVIAYVDESGEIGEHWTSTIWPQLSIAESESLELDSREQAEAPENTQDISEPIVAENADPEDI